jgi:hypothetical protein
MKRTVDELTRLAFIGAEQDSRAMAEAWPSDTQESKEAAELADQFHAYRVKRWGSTEFETRVANSKPVSVFDLRHDPDTCLGGLSCPKCNGSASDAAGDGG